LAAREDRKKQPPARRGSRWKREEKGRHEAAIHCSRGHPREGGKEGQVREVLFSARAEERGRKKEKEKG